ncbi:uncharacterized protein LOC108113644 [Drosophila eugracilis]|uniref:uncharacterized protein LOC108113644 n=1 Tax=Drosophila eugracilis TaxID=29029 RepID=UPI0007E867F7|nr:uncharacterized protein LOC108113644 [Drosophila eugracilis]
MSQPLDWIAIMSIPPWKKDHSWLWLKELNGCEASLKLRHYKRKPNFRPRASVPETPDNEVKSKLEATRGKLLRLLRRFDEVDSIVEASRLRPNPFETLDFLAVSLGDLESPRGDDIPKQEKAMEEQVN